MIWRMRLRLASALGQSSTSTARLGDDAPQSRTTEMKKLLLATAAVMAALAGPVQAETVNGWTIEYWPDASAGACAAGMNYPSSKTKLLFVRMYNAQNNNASEWGIMLTNNIWKTKDKKYEVIVEMEAKGRPKKTLIKSFNGTDSGGLVARDFTIERGSPRDLAIGIEEIEAVDRDIQPPFYDAQRPPRSQSRAGSELLRG
jgi:hypothetical protein